MNVRLRWSLPTVTSRQRPIDRVELFARVSESLPFALINSVTPSQPQELLIENVDPGDWEYGAQIVDAAGVAGPMVTTTTSIPFDGPGTVVGLAATQE